MRKYETISNTTLKEDLYFATLPNGLPVYFCPKPGFEKRYACFSTRYGSIDYEFVPDGGSQPIRVPDGIAHFLEHQLFEGPDGNALDLLSANGAAGNAYTSFTQTTYLFSCSEAFYENLELLLSFVRTPYFKEGRVEKEKGIIIQEIGMYEDSPDWVIYMGLLGALFAKHPVRIDIAGTADSVRSINADLLLECYRTFYQPSNMMLFVVGDLFREELFDFVEGLLCSGGAPASSAGEIERRFPEEPEAVHERSFRRAMRVAMPKMFLGFKETVKDRNASLLRRELVSDFALDLLFGRSSELFQSLYERKLINDTFGSSYAAFREIGYSYVGGDTPDPEGLERELLVAIEQAADRGFADEEFERRRRKFMGQFIRHFNSLEFIANHFTAYRFFGENLFDAIDVLGSIEKHEVESRLRQHLRPEQSAVSVITVSNGN